MKRYWKRRVLPEWVERFEEFKMIYPTYERKIRNIEGALSIMLIGSFESIEDLPHKARSGDLALVNEDKESYVYNGEKWAKLGSDSPPKKILPRFCETCGANLKGRNWCEYCGNEY